MDHVWKFRRRTMLSGIASMMMARAAPALASTNSTMLAGKPKPSHVTRQLQLGEFMELSKFATAQQQLDAKTGSHILTSLSLDPAVRDRLVPLFEQVQQAIASGSTDPMDFMLRHNHSLDVFREIIRCWYTGIRWVDGKPLIFGYFDALMFRAVDGIRNIPATCGGTLNYWSDPPQG